MNNKNKVGANLELIGWVGRIGDIATIEHKDNIKVRTLSISTWGSEYKKAIWFTCEFWGDDKVKLTKDLLKGDRVNIKGLFTKQDIATHKTTGEVLVYNKVYVNELTKLPKETK